MKRRLLEPCLLVSILLVAGCTHWHTERASPASVLASKPRSRIRVTRVDDSRVVVRNPRLVGDTIVDASPPCLTGTKVPLSDVSKVAIRKWDPLRTFGLVISTAAVAGVAALAAVWHYPD